MHPRREQLQRGVGRAHSALMLQNTQPEGYTALPHGCKIHPCHEAVAQWEFRKVCPRECLYPGR
jgi:hypothetical protein